MKQPQNGMETKETTGAVARMNDPLRAIVDRHERDHLFSGAVLVQAGSESLLAEARGFAHRGHAVPNRVETRFDTASLGKLFTAAAAFRLVERGILGLDESVVEISGIEATRIPGDVTIRHCLTHTSGIADDADEESGEDYEGIWRERPCYMVRECADFLPQFAGKEPLFPAGTRSRYNNCAYVLVGLALERRIGLGFREIVAREVIGPIGLARTGYFPKDGIDAEVAEGYATIEGEGGKPSGFRKNIFSFPPIGSPDAGICTTVQDLALFFAAIEKGPFLSESTRAEFLSPKVDAFRLRNGDMRRYGYGFEHDFGSNGQVIRYGKDGLNPGVAAIAMRYPASGGFIAILSNQDAAVWGMCRELAQAAGFTD